VQVTQNNFNLIFKNKMKNTVLYVSLVAASKYIGAGVAVSVL